MNHIFQILNKEDISLHKNRDSIREVLMSNLHHQIFLMLSLSIFPSPELHNQQPHNHHHHHHHCRHKLSPHLCFCSLILRLRSFRRSRSTSEISSSTSGGKKWSKHPPRHHHHHHHYFSTQESVILDEWRQKIAILPIITVLNPFSCWDHSVVKECNCSRKVWRKCLQSKQ